MNALVLILGSCHVFANVRLREITKMRNYLTRPRHSLLFFYVFIYASVHQRRKFSGQRRQPNERHGRRRRAHRLPSAGLRFFDHRFGFVVDDGVNLYSRQLRLVSAVEVVGWQNIGRDGGWQFGVCGYVNFGSSDLQKWHAGEQTTLRRSGAEKKKKQKTEKQIFFLKKLKKNQGGFGPNWGSSRGDMASLPVYCFVHSRYEARGLIFF